MSVGVAGASGFIGTELTREMVSRGLRPIALTRVGGSSLGHGGATENRQLSNPLDAGDWRRILRGIESVVYLIGHAHTTDSEGSAKHAMRHSNVLVAKAFLSAAEQSPVGRIVFVSSVKAITETTQVGHPIDSTTPARPTTDYGRSKLEAEEHFASWSQRTGRPVVILRPPLVYGPQVRANFAALMKIADSALPLPLAGIKNSRSLMSVRNLCDAIIHSLTVPTSDAALTSLVADGSSLSTPELVSTLRRGMERPTRLFPIPPRVLVGGSVALGMRDRMGRLVDSLEIRAGAAQRILRWDAPYSVRDELLRTAVEYKRRRDSGA